MFEDFEFEEQKFHPWDVQSLEEFRFYCCPECPSKTLNKTEFIKHAVTRHSNSVSYIDRIEDNKTGIKIESIRSTNETQESHNNAVELCYISNDSSESSCSESDDDTFPSTREEPVEQKEVSEEVNSCDSSLLGYSDDESIPELDMEIEDFESSSLKGVFLT